MKTGSLSFPLVNRWNTGIPLEAVAKDENRGASVFINPLFLHQDSEAVLVASLYTYIFTGKSIETTHTVKFTYLILCSDEQIYL